MNTINRYIFLSALKIFSDYRRFAYGVAIVNRGMLLLTNGKKCGEKYPEDDYCHKQVRRHIAGVLCTALYCTVLY